MVPSLVVQLHSGGLSGHKTKMTNARIAPGLLNELQRLIPADDVGERQYKHHQWLSDDFGQPETVHASD